MKKQAVFIYEISTCNRRKLDGYKLYEYFTKNNYRIVNNPKLADFIILITCAYSNKHNELSLEMTKKFLEYNAELIVVGCLPNIDKENLRNIFEGKTIGTNELEKIDDFFPKNKLKFSDLKDANSPWENVDEYESIISLKKMLKNSQTATKLQNGLSNYLEKKFLHKKSANYHETVFNYITAKYVKEKWNPNYSIYKDAYFIRPSWGCLSNCSYCVIKNAIGPLKSKSLDVVITEFRNGLNLKYNNFIFDADDIGAYGIDIGTTLSELLDKITDIPGDYKIHIRNINPVWIVKYANGLEKVIRKNKIKGIGCSIQSGNPRILKLMQRYSDTEKIKDAFFKLFESCPDLILGTECISGFPTETMYEFTETLDFIKEIDFSLGYIFPFSCRSGTAAEKINPKIPDNEISYRMRYARKYLKKIGYNNSFIKNYKILLFTKDSPEFQIDNQTKIFCLSTLD